MTGVDYSTLVPTALGGVLALGGGFLGQWWGERRAVAREQRDRAHESQVWARTHQKDAYVNFFLKSERVVKDIDIQRGKGVWKTIESAGDLLPAMSMVRIFGSTEATLASERMATTILLYANPLKEEPPPTTDAMWEARKRYVLQVRRDLGLPELDEAITHF
jgi:hypothetical protein